MFWIDESWNQLGPNRSSLDPCFINAVRLSTWAIYKVHLNRWKASNRRFYYFTPERKMHTCAKCNTYAIDKKIDHQTSQLSFFSTKTHNESEICIRHVFNLYNKIHLAGHVLCAYKSIHMINQPISTLLISNIIYYEHSYPAT